MEERTGGFARYASLWLLPAMMAQMVLVACGEDEVVEPEPDPPQAAGIAISPTSATLTALGEIVMFTAAVTDQYGASFSTTVNWSSSDTGVFTVDSNGNVTAVGNGTGTVTASVAALSATASVTVTANQAPRVRAGVREGATVQMAAGGGPRPWQPANRFEDPDNDVLDLTYTVTVVDPSVAEAEIVVDEARIPWVVMAGTAPGATQLTVTATDPGGLSADVSIVLDVDDSGLSPLSGIAVANNRIQVPNLTLLGGCTPPFVNSLHSTGIVFTITGSKWQTRSDEKADWADVAGTEVMTGQMCTHGTKVPGEYRLAMDVYLTLGPGLEPIQGAYTATNTFVVEPNPGGMNRAPEVSATAPAGLLLSAGGGPHLLVPGAHLSDPDFDDLTFTTSVSDPTLVSAEVVTDATGRTIVVATGLAAGTGTITVTATDPGGLSADLELAMAADDSGHTPYPTIGVANGVLRLLGFGLTVCSPPFIGLPGVDNWLYTVHSSRWQTRSDANSAWTDVDGTEITDGRLCPYTAEASGDYRLVYDATIVVAEDVEPFRGNYASFNFFTVSGS